MTRPTIRRTTDLFFGTWINTAVYGYISGGTTDGGGTKVATTDKLTYATDVTAAQTASNLPETRANSLGLSDTNIYGYSLGGDTGAYTNTGIRFTLSTAAYAANTASNLTANKTFISPTGLSDKQNSGYILGGYTGAYVATGDKMTFSTSTTAASTVSNLSTIGGFVHNIYGGTTYGYSVGGYRTGAVSAVADRITFTTSATAANTASNLSIAKYAGGVVSDQSTYGYICGGYTATSSGFYAATDRMTFSTGACAANTVSNISVARGQLATVSGTTAGYIMGGLTNNARSAITDKLVFSTGVTAAQTSANCSSVKIDMCGFSDRCA
jgi:hypothetical protein